MKSVLEFFELLEWALSRDFMTKKKIKPVFIKIQDAGSLTDIKHQIWMEIQK